MVSITGCFALRVFHLNLETGWKEESNEKGKNWRQLKSSFIVSTLQPLSSDLEATLGFSGVLPLEPSAAPHLDIPPVRGLLTTVLGAAEIVVPSTRSHPAFPLFFLSNQPSYPTCASIDLITLNCLFTYPFSTLVRKCAKCVLRAGTVCAFSPLHS